jgi:WD40 repeat protein
MKFLVFLFLAISISAELHAQAAPAIDWQKCLGGSGNEDSYSIIQTADGGYAVAGHTGSTDGDVSANHGNEDAWVVKLNSSGSIIWQKALGGTMNDGAASIVQTSDGGYAIAGYTNSDDGDVSGLQGTESVWVVKLDASGSIQWQKCLGGSGDQYASTIVQTSDGGYAVAAYTTSNDGDVSGNHGNGDVWVVKLDDSGSIVWQKCFGGSGYDYPNSMIQTSDGGFAIAGETNSNDGDVTGYHGSGDGWVIKLDASGKLTWQIALGDSNSQESYSIVQTSDGGYAMGGWTNSNDSAITGDVGNGDMWVVKLNASGGILWQKVFGSTGDEAAQSILQTPDGGYAIGGWTTSIDGKITGNHGGEDVWVVRLDAAGSLVWQKCLGGSGYDEGRSLCLSSDGSYAVTGSTNTNNDGDVSGFHGTYDIWVVKLKADTPDTVIASQLKVVSPNGGEFLLVGSFDTLRWAGVPSNEKVDLDYSTDDGATWLPIVQQVSGLEYPWLVPNTISNQCLLRATLPGRVVRDSALYDSIPHATDPHYGFGWSPDSRYIAFSGTPADLLLTSDLSTYYSFTTDNAITVTFSPDSKRILYRGYNYPAQMVDIATKTVLRQYLIHVVHNVLWNPAGGSFMSIGPDLLNWDADSVRVLDTMKERPYSDSRVDQWSPDGKRFAGLPGFQQASNNYARIYDPATGDSLLYLQGDSDFTTDIRYDHKGDRLLTIGYDSTIRIWDASTGMLLHRIVQQSLDYSKVRWSADDKFIAAGLFDADSVIIWDASSGLQARVLHFYSYAPSSLDWSPNGKWIAIASGDLIFFFDEATGELIQTLLDPDNVIANVEVAMQWSPDSTRLAGVDGRVKIWFVDPRAKEIDTSDAKWSIVSSLPKNVVLSIGSGAAQQGQTVLLPITLVDPAVAKASGADSVSASLSFDATLLVPSGSTPLGTISGTTRTIPLSFPVNSASDSVLGMLTFTATLGDDTTTTLHLSNQTSNPAILSLSSSDSTFTLLGVCTSGGLRLLNPNGVATITSIQPNPAQESILVNLSLTEQGRTVIDLLDTRGRIAKILFDGTPSLGQQTLTFDLHGLASGAYSLRLTTPTIHETHPIEIVK